VYCGYTTTKIDHLDLKRKRIFLRSGTVNYHPVEDIYKEVRFIRRVDVSLRNIKIPVQAGGGVSKGGGKFTPRYAVFNNGWRIVPQDSTHALYIEGEQITDDGQSGPAVLDTSLLSSGTNVTIHYEPPTSELVGGSSSLTVEEIVTAIDNTSVILASIKASTDTIAQLPLDTALAVRAELSAELAKLDANISSRVASGTIIEANVRRVNNIPIIGTGADNDLWRPS
jgi:hypothetical protein